MAIRWLAEGQAPAYRAIAKFRKRHLSALGHLFVQALELCQAAGMVSRGKVALDGTKVRANASRRKAMSHARMTEKQKIRAAEVSELLAEAERIDKDEDAKCGKDNTGFILRGIRGVLAITANVICAFVAKSKGYSAVLFGILGLIFSIITLIVVLVIPRKR